MPVALQPNDPHDARLLARVRPADYRNPTPKPRYQLVVLGGGPAGLVAAAGAAGLGASVALVESELLGGDCLTAGCVPSKTLLRAAHAAHAVRAGKPFGVSAGEPVVDFAAVMERVRKVRADLSAADSVERFTGLGVDVFRGIGRFADAETVEVAGAKLRFGRCLIATGARPKMPDLLGIPDELRFTNETIFALTSLPRKLLVVGGGPVGCELAQAFARLGSAVTLQSKDGKLLPKEDPAAVALVVRRLRADGITLSSATPRAGDFDAVLVAAGRSPNVESLNLPAANIAFDAAHGVTVDDSLRTTNARVYAAGDVCSFGQRFTHAADAMARLALRNMLFPGRGSAAKLVIPRCTYTDPELAAVGKPTHAPEPGATTFSVTLDDVDRGAADGATGFVTVVVEPGSDRIAGATVVGPRAGELIGTIALLMSNGIGLKAVAGGVVPYPTYTDALKKVADQYNRTRLTPWSKRVLGAWLRVFR